MYLIFRFFLDVAVFNRHQLRLEQEGGRGIISQSSAFDAAVCTDVHLT